MCGYRYLRIKPILVLSLLALSCCSDPEALPELYTAPGVTTTNVSPTAVFSLLCNNLNCDFDAGNSADSDGTIATYQWDFGDGVSGSGVTPSHSYTSDNIYTVILTVTDDLGGSSSSSIDLAVSSGNTPPVASFASNCPDLNCSFDATTSNDPDGSIASYQWDFGDSNSGAGVTANHTFAMDGTYMVSLTVTDDAGVSSSSSTSLTVSTAGGNNPPLASFSYACPDLACDFDASASLDSDGAITSYSWDFGDGNAGTTSTPSHTYAADGNYTIVLTVTDNSGASSNSSQTVFVSSGNIAPSSVFSFVCTDLSCDFDGSASFDVDGTITNYSWNFGDGSTATGVTSIHVFSVQGDYSVMLMVTDNASDSANSAQNVSVTAANVQEGMTLFNNNCSTCHGADAQGGTLAKKDIRGATADTIRNAINTIAQMNSQSARTDAELQAIAAYLATL